jgi:hypothetical protein
MNAQYLVTHPIYGPYVSKKNCPLYGYTYIGSVLGLYIGCNKQGQNYNADYRA